MKKQIVIIGNGIAGATAARELRKKDPTNQKYSILIISEEHPLFFSRTALMYVYMGHMTKENITPYPASFWKKNDIDLHQDRVLTIDSVNKQVNLKSGDFVKYDELIIATGSKPRSIGMEGQNLKGVQGMYHMQDLDALPQSYLHCKNAVITGAGLIGIELAEMLLTRGITVDFLIRDSYYWANVLPKGEGDFLQKHFDKHHGITFHYNEEIESIQGDGISVSGVKTKSGKTLECGLLGVTIGVESNVSWLQGTENLTINRGIVVNTKLQTSLPNVYAIGDCAEIDKPNPDRKAIEAVWYSGRMMGEQVAKVIDGDASTYDPGVWFNSAKFFDIEYQTYGNVPNQGNEITSLFHWIDPKKERMITLAFNPISNVFIGINCYGIRLRHAIFEDWLKQKASVEFVLQNLATANFDPEFFKTYETQFLESFNNQFKTAYVLKKKVWWKSILTKTTV